MSNVIEVRSVSKLYRQTSGQTPARGALAKISLEIRQGEIFGLLGPNGAGKTTLMKIMLGVTRPTAGDLSVLGSPAGSPETLKHIGFLPENFHPPPHLEVAELLKSWGTFYGLKGAVLLSRVGESLERLGLTNRADAKVKTLSKGLLQRMGLAQAIVHDPQLLFLDEPTDGLDPVGRREVRELLLRFKQEGKTIVLNSHLLSEVERTCDRAGIIDNGRLLRVGTIEEMTSGGGYLVAFSGAEVDVLRQRFKIKPWKEGTLWVLRAENRIELDRAMGIILASGLHVESIRRDRADLEEVFMRIINAARLEEVE